MIRLKQVRFFYVQRVLKLQRRSVFKWADDIFLSNDRKMFDKRSNCFENNNDEVVFFVT